MRVKYWCTESNRQWLLARGQVLGSLIILSFGDFQRIWPGVSQEETQSEEQWNSLFLPKADSRFQIETCGKGDGFLQKACVMGKETRGMPERRARSQISWTGSDVFRAQASEV